MAEEFEMNTNNGQNDEQDEAQEKFYLNNAGYGETPREVFATKSESASIENASAKLVIRVPWEDRYNAITDLFEGEAGNPKRYPYKLTQSGSELYAVNISNIEPMQTEYDAEGQAIGYKWALITVDYEPLETQVTITSTTEFVKVNPAGLYWDTKRNGVEMKIPLAQDQAPGIPIRSFEISLSRKHMIPFNIFQWEGTCNATAVALKRRYLGDVFTFPPQTLALQSPEIQSPSYMISETGHCTVSCKLLYNPLGHNVWYDPLQDSSVPNPNPDLLEYHTVHIVKAVERAEGSGTVTDYPAIMPLAPVDYDPLFEVFDIKEFV